MSAPPPGGSPPPQSPPPYPQYPPQQPYPQQPYGAPPAAPPPKKSHTALIIVLVVVIVVVVLAAVGWYVITLLTRPITNTGLTVTGVSWTINYPGTNHYFGNSPITTCTTCPISVAFPWQFQYTLTLTNSDSVAHNVTGISVSGVTFNLVSSTPDPSTSLPTVVNAGASQSFVLTIQASPFSGSYTLTGTITTE